MRAAATSPWLSELLRQAAGGDPSALVSNRLRMGKHLLAADKVQAWGCVVKLSRKQPEGRAHRAARLVACHGGSNGSCSNVSTVHSRTCNGAAA